MNQKTPFFCQKKGREPLTPIRICGGYGIVPVRVWSSPASSTVSVLHQNKLLARHPHRKVCHVAWSRSILAGLLLVSLLRQVGENDLDGDCVGVPGVVDWDWRYIADGTNGPTSRLWEGCRITGIGCVSIPCTK